MLHQASGNNVRVLVMDETTGTANIATITVAFRSTVLNVTRTALSAKMDLHSYPLSSDILSSYPECPMP